MYISISSRILVNLESLNSVETVGALVRHRTAPISIPEEDGYRIKFVPVISGESIAHAYQELIVDEAIKMGLPVGKYSAKYEFIKYADEGIMKEEGIEVPKMETDILRAELEVLNKDVVADIGGFLFAGNYPVKRTSRFYVGYMVPAIYDVDAAALEAQFHVRMVPSKVGVKGERGRAPPQAPYNVEVASALYTFTFNLDIDGIAVPSTKFGEAPNELLNKLTEQKKDRVILALRALAKLFSGNEFGAKRTRFLPNMEYKSMIAAFSHGCRFNVSPGNSKKYVSDTVLRAKDYLDTLKKLGYNDAEIKIVVYDTENASLEVEDIERVDTPEAVVKRLVDLVLERL